MVGKTGKNSQLDIFNYTLEKDARIGDEINIMIQRKFNLTRKREPWIGFLKEYSRKRIEKCFSEIKNLFLRKKYHHLDEKLDGIAPNTLIILRWKKKGLITPYQIAVPSRGKIL